MQLWFIVFLKIRGIDLKNILTSLVLGLSLLVASVGNGYAQDYLKGLEAQNKGDFATALREWTPLAEQGDADAQFVLGVMYKNGQGVTQDYKEAVKWWRKAAEQGYAKAQSNLGLMYDKGQGVLQDNVYAHMWWNIAASSGDLPNAAKNRDSIAKGMTAADISKAQALARECVKKNYKGC